MSLVCLAALCLAVLGSTLAFSQVASGQDTAKVEEKEFVSPPLPAAPQPASWMQSVDNVFGAYLVRPLFAILFFDFGTERFLGQGRSIPLVLVWLTVGAVYFTFRMQFIAFRGFWHGILLTLGYYDKPGQTGEVSHFQALASALSGTLGLGNISGVALAVMLGGPGVVFWLIVSGLIGMSSKFVECSLGQMYRTVQPDGTVLGGPMRYLKVGLDKYGWSKLGAVLAPMFAILCIGGSLGGGCAFQVGQSLGAVQEQFPWLRQHPYVYGIVLAVLTGIVIVGGIRRIGATADKLVPFMCGVYLLMCFWVLGYHYDRIWPATQTIFTHAFTGSGIVGGVIAVMVIGIRRASFSNEAGIGSASIAHSAAKTEEPISEGMVALLEPFVDTVVVCTITGLVIVVTGVCDNPDFASLITEQDGAAMTSRAFGGVVGWFPPLLAAVVFLFAFATLISWSYYGERCAIYLLGPKASLPYKALFLAFTVLGSIVTKGNVIDFSDLMLLAMAFPNVLGLWILSGEVRERLEDYWKRYQAGELDPQKHAQATNAKLGVTGETQDN
jgi:AGCS family alanine or glycine:cation symporter